VALLISQNRLCVPSAFDHGNRLVGTKSLKLLDKAWSRLFLKIPDVGEEFTVGNWLTTSFRHGDPDLAIISHDATGQAKQSQSAWDTDPNYQVCPWNAYVECRWTTPVHHPAIPRDEIGRQSTLLFTISDLPSRQPAYISVKGLILETEEFRYAQRQRGLSSSRASHHKYPI